MRSLGEPEHLLLVKEWGGVGSSGLGEARSLERTQVALPRRWRGAGDASLQPHHISELHVRSTSGTEPCTHFGEKEKMLVRVEVVCIVGDSLVWF